MPQTPTKFYEFQQVRKISGAYGGPGKVISVIKGEPNKYVVAHKIEGGWGQLLHIYAEDQLEAAD